MSHPWYERYHGFLLASLICAHTAVLLTNILFNAVSWDEGWNFCVAKNLVQEGHYGCSFGGELTTPRLSQGPLIVGPAALGFKLFGVGIAQGRLFQAILTLLGIWGLYFLTRRIAGKNIALLALLYLLGASGDYRIHPGILGGQAWGETTVIFFVALATLCLCRVPARNRGPTTFVHTLSHYLLPSIGAGVSLAFACSAKYQATPFVTLGLLGVSLYAVRIKDFRALGALALTWVVKHYFQTKIQSFPLPYRSPINLSGVGVEGILEASALVFDLNSRIEALEHTASEAWPLILALGAMTLKKLSSSDEQKAQTSFVYAKLFLYVVCLSWLSWYLLAARPFRRYLAPPILLGAPFVAFALSQWLKSTRMSSRGRRLTIYSLTTLGICNILIVGNFLYSMSPQNSALLNTAQYLNESFPRGTLIETYDSQLFFLLKQPFIYPPDQAHLFGISRNQDEAGAYRAEESPAQVFVLGGWSSFVFEPLFRGIQDSSAMNCTTPFAPYKVCSRLPKE